jgi:hypothetical protein
MNRTSWHTTVAGIVTAAFGFVLFSPDLFEHWPWLIALAKYVTVGGLATMGIAGRDADK